MKSKYKRNPITVNDINPKRHPWIGVIWPVVGSKGSSYEVELTDKGFTCTCTGFAYHEKCKHISAVGDKFCIDN